MFKVFVIIMVLISTGASAVTKLPCNDIPDGISQLFKSNNILLFGEMHGTKETPERFYDVVCNASQTGLKIKIGLEMPFSMTDELEKFSNFKSIKKLLKTEFWSSKQQSGRTSISMLTLLNSVNNLGLNNDNVSTFFFDHSTVKREQLMAQNIIEKIERDALMIILTGNIHSRITHGRPWDKLAKNMGALIKEKHSTTTSIFMSYSGGNGWVCMPECGVHEFGSYPYDANNVFKKNIDNHHHWEWNIGKVTASRPAKLLLESVNKKEQTIFKVLP
jgi:hypothetical protein